MSQTTLNTKHLAAKAPAQPTEERSWAILLRVWRLWARSRLKLILLNLGLLVLFSAVNGLYAPIVKFIVDSAEKGSSDFSWILAAALAVTVAKAATLLGHRMLNVRLFAQIALDMQRTLYDKMIRADIAWHGREAAAKRAARITSDVGAVQNALERVTNNLIRDLTMIVFVGISMIWIDWQLALITLGIFPIAILPISKIARTLRKIGKQTQERIGSVSARLIEGLAAIRLAKTYQLEERLRRRSSEDMQELRKLQIRSGDHAALIDPLLEILGGLAVVAVLSFVGWRIEEGTNSLGDFAGFITALLLMGQPMRAIGNVAGHVQRGVAAAQRVFHVLDEPPRVVDAPNAQPLAVTQGEVAFENVGFAYPDGSIALKGVTLRAAPGEKLALVGRSGAGKSTLFNLIPRLFDPTEGRILIDGQDIREAQIASLRSSIALVSQDAVMFDDTVRANIGLGRDEPGVPPDEARVIEAAKEAAAHDFIMELPRGYDTTIGEAGGRLSGGQRQRLSIARAFYRDAPILLLDEATSALDAEAEDLLKGALRRLSEGRTSIVIAHRLSTIMDAHKIAVLDMGRLIEFGSHDELVKKGGIYEMLFRLQYRDVLGDD